MHSHFQAESELNSLFDRLKWQEVGEKEARGETILSMLFQPKFLKPFVIVNIFNFLQILAGTYLIIFYAVDILSHIKGASVMDSYVASVLTALVRVVFSILASFLLTVVGRRVIAMTSGLGTAIAAFCLGAYLLWHDPSCPTNGYYAAMWVFAYVAANTIGLMALPGVMIELFPAKSRGTASSITFTAFFLYIFAITKIFPLLKSWLGVAGVFCLFSVTSLLYTLLAYLVLPETKGKSLHEIEDYFGREGIVWRRKKGLLDSNKGESL